MPRTLHVSPTWSRHARRATLEPPIPRITAATLLRDAAAKLSRAASLLDTTGGVDHPSVVSNALLGLVLRSTALAGELHATASVPPVRSDDAPVPTRRTAR